MKTKTFEEFSENKTPKIVIYNSLMEYTETYEIDSNIEEFEENYLEYFSEYLDDNLTEEDGYYEFDGDQGDYDYLIQLNLENDDENEDWEKTFAKAVNKIKKFFKNKKISLNKIE